jgi:hypothetical protein
MRELDPPCPPRADAACNAPSLPRDSRDELIEVRLGDRPGSFAALAPSISLVLFNCRFPCSLAISAPFPALLLLVTS